MRYKVALIGSGWIGVGAELDLLRLSPASHAQAIAAEPRAQLAAFVDTEDASLAIAARLYPNVPRFRNATDMFQEVRPDIVAIATPPESHCHYIMQACECPVRAILSEKPIAHDLADSRAAVDRCREGGVILMVNHFRRMDPWLRRLRSYLRHEHVRNTAIGQVRSATASYDHGLYHGGTHIVDLLRYFLGDVQWVSAVPNERLPAPPGDVNVDGILGFEDCNAVLHFVNSKEYAFAELALLGERGRVVLKHMWGGVIEVSGTHACSDYSAYRELDDANARSFGEPRSFMAGVYGHLIDCVEGKDVAVSSGSEAVKTLEVLDALARSARAGGTKVCMAVQDSPSRKSCPSGQRA